jgi:hypothetical protein
MLEDCENTYHHVDDVISHSKEWEEHMEVTRQFRSRVKIANFSLRPLKVLGTIHWISWVIQ